MMRELRALEVRKAALQSLTAAQRNVIARDLSALADRLTVVDRVVGIARALAARPLVLGSIAALLLAIGRLGLFGRVTRIAAYLGLARRLAVALAGDTR